MKKYFLSVAIFLMLLLASTIFLPYLFKDQIIEAIKKQANDNLKAQVDFDNNISINIFKSFPNLTLGIKDLSLTYENVFFNDTLLSLDKLEVSFDMVEFYKNKNYILKSLILDRPNLNLEYVNDSLFNWDLISSDSSNGDFIDLQLQSIEIKNGTFEYRDLTNNLVTSLKNINHQSSGKYNNNNFSMNASTMVDDVLISYSGIPYVSNWFLNQNGPINIDLTNNKYSFGENELFINGIQTTLNGFVHLIDEDILFDLKSNSNSPDLNQFLTLIPAIYKSDFNKLKTKGSGSLAIEYVGKYSETSYPGFDVKLNVDNGWFKYPDLELPAEDLFLKAHLFSSDGNPDHTIIDVSNINFKIEDNPFSLKLFAQNLFQNPFIDLSTKGIINLSTLSKVVPLHGTQLAGMINSDIQVRGNVGGSVTENIQNIQAKGTFLAQNLIYKSPEMNEILTIKTADLNLSNNLVKLNSFDGKLGQNEIKAEGKLKNLYNYLLSEGSLTGTIRMQSNHLNLNDFITESENSDTVKMTLIEVPGDIHLRINANIENLLYDDLSFSNFSGNATVVNNSVILENIVTDLLGGKLNLNGTYLYHEKEPRAHFDISYSDISTTDLLSKFKVVRVFAPLASDIKALSTAKLSFASVLNNDMSPNLSNLTIGGLLNLEAIKVNSLDVLNSIDKSLGTNHFNIEYLNDLLIKFSIKDGKLFVDPFNLFIDSSILNISGISKIDGTINYNGLLSIPSNYVKNEVSTVNSLIKNSGYTKLELNPNEYLDLAIQIVGTVKKPEVELNLKEIKNNFKETVTSTVSDEVAKKKKEAEELVKDELDKIKDETSKNAKEAELRLKEEAARKKKEAEDKLKAETEAAKKKLEDEAKKKLRKLIK
jgi:hypothetical protein